MKRKIILFLLKTVAALPLCVLYLFADFIFVVVYYLVGYRKKIVRKNIVEAFPEKSPKEIKSIERQFYRFLCDVIVETIKLLHISDKEIHRRAEILNVEAVNHSIEAGRSVVILLGHYGNWEWVQEIGKKITDKAYKASIYHPLSNPLWDSIFSDIRGRWGMHIVPQKKAPRVLLAKENRPWACGFIADHRPLQVSESNVIRFLNHNTAFIYGPEEIGNKVGADFFYLEMSRKKRGYYRIRFHELSPSDKSVPYPYTRLFWKEFEKTIRKHPELWLWSHKRWKFEVPAPMFNN